MDIHKPHAARSWSGFLAELGTIVAGILIALALDQAVDRLHWRNEVRDAQSAMRAELGQDNLDAYYRLAIEPCAAEKLAQIETALIASRDKGTPVPLIEPYSRPLRPWLSDAWDSARALQITSHIPTATLTDYSRAYFFPTSLRATQPREREAMSELNTLSVNAGKLQPGERDRLFLALSKARAVDYEMTYGAWLTIKRTSLLGLGLSKGEKAEQLAAARQDFGACAAAPDLRNPPLPTDTTARQTTAP